MSDVLHKEEEKIVEESRDHAVFVRNIIFGVEDSLVSTVGLLAGMATGNIETSKIFAIGAIFLFVEGFSMAAGSYLSEHSTQEYENGEVQNNDPLKGAIAMFFSFVIAGIVPIAPYLFLPLGNGLIVSIVLSLVFLGILGYALARVSKVSALRNIIRMVVVGGVAIVLGVIIGKLFGIS